MFPQSVELCLYWDIWTQKVKDAVTEASQALFSLLRLVSRTVKRAAPVPVVTWCNSDELLTLNVASGADEVATETHLTPFTFLYSVMLNFRMRTPQES